MKRSAGKRVHCGEKLVLDSPDVKSRPMGIRRTIRIGTINLDISEDETGHACNQRIPKEILKKADSTKHENIIQSDTTHGSARRKEDSNSPQERIQPPRKLQGYPDKCIHRLMEVINRAQHLGSCTRCLSVNHDRAHCFSTPQRGLFHLWP